MPCVQAIADKWLIGNVDLASDTHALDDGPAMRKSLLALYE